MYFYKNYLKLYFHDNEKLSWLLPSLFLFLLLAHSNDNFILILSCFPLWCLIKFRSWLNNEALSFQILCKSMLCPLGKTLLCSPVVIVLACCPAFNYLLHNSLGNWKAFIAALTLDIIRRKCGVRAGVSLEQRFLYSTANVLFKCKISRQGHAFCNEFIGNFRHLVTRDRM